MTTTYLDRIVRAHREAARSDTRNTETLRAEALSCGATSNFRSSLLATPGTSVIAEIKRRSPSAGDLKPGLSAAGLARQYEDGGAVCLSVLTDEDWFGGSVSDLQQARAVTSMPVLRKDFTVTENDVCDTRIMGADCVLLIVAALSSHELKDFLELARSVDLDALVEVHDESELELALQVGADLIGVNQRDLTTFEVDPERATRLAQLFPSGVARVGESGIRGPADVTRLADAGYDAVLVGESLVRSSNPTAAVRALQQAGC